MDIISKGDLSITNYEGKMVLSFQGPSLVDYVGELSVQKSTRESSVMASPIYLRLKYSAFIVTRGAVRLTLLWMNSSIVKVGENLFFETMSKIEDKMA